MLSERDGELSILTGIGGLKPGDRHEQIAGHLAMPFPERGACCPVMKGVDYRSDSFRVFSLAGSGKFAAPFSSFLQLVDSSLLRASHSCKIHDRHSPTCSWSVILLQTSEAGHDTTLSLPLARHFCNIVQRWFKDCWRLCMSLLKVTCRWELLTKISHTYI